MILDVVGEQILGLWGCFGCCWIWLGRGVNLVGAWWYLVVSAVVVVYGLGCVRVGFGEFVLVDADCGLDLVLLFSLFASFWCFGLDLV